MSNQQNQKRVQTFTWAQLGLEPSLIGAILGPRGATIQGIGRSSGNGCRVYYQKEGRCFEISAWTNRAIQLAVLSLKQFAKTTKTKTTKTKTTKMTKKKAMNSYSNGQFALLADEDEDEDEDEEKSKRPLTYREVLAEEFRTAKRAEVSSIEQQYAVPASASKGPPIDRLSKFNNRRMIDEMFPPSTGKWGDYEDEEEATLHSAVDRVRWA